MSKATFCSVILALMLSLPAYAGGARIVGVCDGASYRRDKPKRPNDVLVVCPNGRVQLRITGYCGGGVVRAYYGREDWLTCNSTANPLVITQPPPTQTVRLP